MSTLLVSLILQNAWSAIVKNKKFEKEGGEEMSDNLFDILNFTALSVTSFTSLCSALLICINARAYSCCGEKAVRFYNGLDKSEREKFTQALRATNLDAAIEKHSTSIADDRKVEQIKAKKKRVRRPKQFKKPKVTSKPGKAPAEKKVSAELHSEIKKGKIPVRPCKYGDGCHHHKKGKCYFFHAKINADHLKHSRSEAGKARQRDHRHKKERQQVQEKTSSALSKATYHAKGGKGNTNKGKKMPSQKFVIIIAMKICKKSGLKNIFAKKLSKKKNGKIPLKSTQRELNGEMLKRIMILISLLKNIVMKVMTIIPKSHIMVRLMR
jgi:hypothetical protein